jgi:hypothetical protein
MLLGPHVDRKGVADIFSDGLARTIEDAEVPRGG